MIHYDRSRVTIVVICDQCGWRDVVTTKSGAWRAAEEHEQRTHPGTFQVRAAAYVRASRDRPIGTR